MRFIPNPLTCVVAILFLSSITLADERDILIADFEAADYGDWKVAGEAFGPGPAQGTLPGQMKVDGFQGKRLVNSFYQGDKTTGTLTSPPIKIERPRIQFLIGGGGHEGKTCINLRVDGKIVRTAAGPNTRPGGSEQLEWRQWDVSDLVGKTAVIEIVDDATGGWGHINVDQIVQTNRPMPVILSDATREIDVSKRYLNVPIKDGAAKRVLSIAVDGETVRQFDVELADAEPDWWAFMDLGPFQGKRITLKVNKLAEDSLALRSIEQADAIKGLENLYREPLRSQFHFSPRRGWNNDPNGLAFYNGEYHLFFQHNPYGWRWGNMHWGHAVSRDLVHWQEQGDVLYPDKMGPMFSGSAVVDWKNTSGLGKDGRPPLVLFYTAAGNPAVQCMAYSTDGRTFTKYAGNPIVEQITGGNRDPKVIWHEPSRQWVMTLYVGLGKKTDPSGKEVPNHTIHFLTSPNLKDWTVTSHVEGLYECPDFFELPVDGDATNRKWVLTAASSEYMLGRFDGKTFTAETPKLPGHLGRGFYAAQTFSDIPAEDGRRIQIGWLRAPSPGMPFNQAMSVPLELRLASTPEGARLTFTPVKELESLRAKTHRVGPKRLAPGEANPLADVAAELIEVCAEFEPGEAAEVAFTVRGVPVVYDAAKQTLIVNDHRAAAPLCNGRQRLTIYVDRTVTEVFASDGLSYVPMPFIPKDDDRAVTVSVTGGPATFSKLDVYELKSIWK